MEIVHSESQCPWGAVWLQYSTCYTTETQTQQPSLLSFRSQDDNITIIWFLVSWLHGWIGSGM